MADYKGMRWFKCDLQMQTPADAQHWRGQAMVDTPEGRVEAAEAFIRRCYEVGLEVIAITEHNFLSKDFIPYLQNAIHKMTSEFGYPIVLFPGFELEADVGKGVHVLGIFEPDTAMEEIDHLLTECGVTMPRVKGGILTKSTRRLPELLKCIQSESNGKQRGIVIMPHLMGNDGLFDNDKTNDWLQQEEYLNPELLAVEVPKPVPQMSKNFQRLFNAGDNCDPAWRRERSLACIMSSDNKALTAAEDAGNYIGKRFTWIKMSEPSIEALRQAFLDHESRVRLQTNRPSDSERHPKLVSISVKGAAFLEDQTVNFSPNLNCIIGGRGSGKSSLLEYLRFCIQPNYRSAVDSDLHEKLNAIFRTVDGADSELRVTFETAPGVQDVVLLKPHSGERRLAGREVHDLQTVLNQLHIQFFSQGELSRLSKPGQKNQVLRLVDASVAGLLADLASEESEIRVRLESLFSARRQSEVIGAELLRTRQELEELDRQWHARLEIQRDATAHRYAHDAKRFLDMISQTVQDDITRVATAASFIIDNDVLLPPLAENWPHTEWYPKVLEGVQKGRQQLLDDIKNAFVNYTRAANQAVSGTPEYAAILSELNKADEIFLAACEAKGVTPADASKLQETETLRTAKQEEVRIKDSLLIEAQKKSEELRKELDSLHAVWRKQFEVRQEACRTIERPTTSINAGYMLDSRSFDQIWNRLAPRDNRTRLGRHWEDIGQELFAAFSKSPAAHSPWAVFAEWLETPEMIPVGGNAHSLSPAFSQHIFAPDNDDVRAVWEKVQVTRVDDLIDVELRRADGTSAGRMSGEGGKVLSEGQRNTALLSLILAEGEGPIVIDQPEDELDSNYIFTDLVPILRQTKNARQLILATHNANLPVNADAELIYAFEAVDGHGQKRTEGGLDKGAVTNAVLDIMEGSEAAFKRRSEKYHF